MQKGDSDQYLKVLQSLITEQNDLIDKFKQLIKLENVNLNEHKEQLLEILEQDFSGQGLLYAAQTRIKNELIEFYSKALQHIHVYRLNYKNAILNHILIVEMYGKKETDYEGGIYTFVLKFPENYPFAAPSFKCLLPVKHPHIYPNQRLCTPTIDESYVIQNYSLYELLETWYAILHRDPNKQSLANVEVHEQYSKEFIKIQARFFNFNNPILKLFQKIKIDENNDEEEPRLMSY